jgi:hypothetical protein
VVTKIHTQIRFAIYSPPRLRELRVLRGFLSIAQPPLLEEEGKRAVRETS